MYKHQITPASLSLKIFSRIFIDKTHKPTLFKRIHFKQANFFLTWSLEAQQTPHMYAGPQLREKQD